MIRCVLDAARRGDLRRAARLADAAGGHAHPGGGDHLHLTHLRGGIAFELGRLDEAESRFEEVIRLATHTRDRRFTAKATNNLGSIAHLRGKAVLAASLYHSALDSYRLADDAVGEAQTEHNLGLVERERGELHQADLHAARAVAAAARTGDPGLLALALTGAAETAIERGHGDQARRTLRRALKLARAAGDGLLVVEVQRLEALLAYRARRYAVSLREASRAYLQASRLGNLQISGECAVLSAQACQRLERPRLAERFRRRAEEAFRSLGAVGALRRLELCFAA
jgi:tetratricopeptide (TPR) repeat protein